MVIGPTPFFVTFLAKSTGGPLPRGRHGETSFAIRSSVCLFTSHTHTSTLPSLPINAIGVPQYPRARDEHVAKSANPLGAVIPLWGRRSNALSRTLPSEKTV